MLITREDLEKNIKLTFVSNTYIDDAKEAGIVTTRDEDLDLNKAFYVETDNNWHMVTEADLSESSLTASDIEKAAMDSVKNSKLITASAFDIVSHLMNIPLLGDLDDYADVTTVKAVTENNIEEDDYKTFAKIPYGASVIYNTNLLDEVCKSKEVEELVILPCSTNEIICLPATPDVTENIDYFKALIKMVNSEELGYNTELSDKPYSYKMGGKVTKYEAELECDIER